MGNCSALIVQNGFAQQLALRDWPEIADRDINCRARLSSIECRIQRRAHACIRHCVEDSAMHNTVRI